MAWERDVSAFFTNWWEGKLFEQRPPPPQKKTPHKNHAWVLLSEVIIKGWMHNSLQTQCEFSVSNHVGLWLGRRNFGGAGFTLILSGECGEVRCGNGGGAATSPIADAWEDVSGRWGVDAWWQMNLQLEFKQETSMCWGRRLETLWKHVWTVLA